jgi:hypothetical protein
MTSLLLIVAWIALQSPARDGAAPRATGTAVISGTVVTDDAEGKPVRRAHLMLESGKLEAPQTIVTDDAGRFVFAGLLPGNYTLTAAKPSYVSTSYGANTPGRGPGVPIAIVSGQRVTGLTVKMMRGGVITGIVRLPGGQPAVGANVQLRQVQTIDGQRRISRPQGFAAADDRGEYRLYGLAPGEYLVQIHPGAVLIPGGTDMRRISPAEIRSAEQALSQPASSAGAPSARPSATATSAEPGPAVNQALVYYPGTTDPAAAETVTVGPGQERTGIDVAIEYVPTARIAGTIADPEGRPAQGVQLTLSPKTSPGLSSLIVGRFAARANPDGSFYANGLAPGRYVITARAAQTLWATTEIEVAGRDVSGIALTLQPGIAITGRIAFEATTLAPPAPERVRLALAPASIFSAPQQVDAISAGSTVTVAADGTFAIRGVIPGIYRFVVTPPGATPVGTTAPTVQPWVVKSVMVSGRDLADLQFEIKPGGDIAGIVITVADTPTEISGTLLDQANRPAGEYFVCAVTGVEQDDLNDPIFLDSLVAASFKISIAAGEKKTQTLRLGGR